MFDFSTIGFLHLQYPPILALGGWQFDCHMGMGNLFTSNPRRKIGFFDVAGFAGHRNLSKREIIGFSHNSKFYLSRPITSVSESSRARLKSGQHKSVSLFVWVPGVVNLVQKRRWAFTRGGMIRVMPQPIR